MSISTAMLSLEQTPPLAVPARFFISAPLFALAALGVAAVYGPQLLYSRWQPPLLAVTHLFTLGYLAMVMFGAMFQLLPVLAGVQINRGTTLSAAVHLLLTAGTLLLAIAFLRGESLLFAVAAVVLALALGTFLLVIARALSAAKSLHDTVWAMRMALVALTVTLLLGLWLVAGHAGWVPLARQLTDLHLAWGLLGWAGVLLAGVAYQVVPMFQITTEYPRPLRRWLAWTVALSLLWWSSASALGGSSLWPGIVLAAAFALFAVVTLRLQARRLRRLPDVTVAFWQFAMFCIVLAALLWLLLPQLGAEWYGAGELAWGVLVILGAGVSAISGMLYKIIPFLVWLHLNNRLQAAGQWQGKIPNMRQVIAERASRRHLHLYLGGTVLALAAVFVPHWLFYPALLVLGAAFALQFWNLYAALRLYRRVAGEWQ